MQNNRKRECESLLILRGLRIIETIQMVMFVICYNNVCYSYCKCLIENDIRYKVYIKDIEYGYSINISECSNEHLLKVNLFATADD